MQHRTDQQIYSFTHSRTQNMEQRTQSQQNSQPRSRSRFPRGGRRGGRPQSANGASSEARTAAPRRDGNGQGGDRRRSRRSRNDRNQRGRRPLTSPALTQRMVVRDPKAPYVAPVTDPDTVRIVPLGGVEEVGKNMIAIETAEDILIFDAGFQFVSSENDAPGVNYILPNTQYLEENKDKIRGLII